MAVAFLHARSHGALLTATIAKLEALCCFNFSRSTSSEPRDPRPVEGKRIRASPELWNSRLHNAGHGGSRPVTGSPLLQSSLEGNNSFVTDPCRRLGKQLQSLCDEGQLDKAVDLLSLWEQLRVLPPVSVYSYLLKACTRRKVLAHVKQVQHHLSKHGLDRTNFPGEQLVSSLVKCGGLHDALQVFHALPSRTIFAWAAIISGFAMAGRGQEALRMYYCMQKEGLKPDSHVFVSLLKACGSPDDLDVGKAIHAEAVKNGCESNKFVATCLVEMYAKCGSLAEAHQVFDGLSLRDVVSWNVMIGAYVQAARPEMSLQLYDRMHDEAVSPNDRTFVNAFQACAMLADKEYGVLDGPLIEKGKSLRRGRELHADARRNGLDRNLFVGNTMVSMYGKCGRTCEAHDVFETLWQRNVVSWNAMLGAYAQQDQPEKALQMYERMRGEGLSPDDRTLVTVLQAVGMLGEKGKYVVDGEWARSKMLEKARAVHAEARRKDYDSDVFVGSSLISAYAKCGCISDSQSVFNGLHSRNVVSWNAMLAAYVLQGHPEKAVQLFDQMEKEGMNSDVRTFVTVLQACGMLADQEDTTGNGQKLKSLKKGKAIHAKAQRKGYHSNPFLGSTLVSMYGKCGSISDALNVFNGLCHHNVVAWTALLSAFVDQGHKENAMHLYKQMLQEGVNPDEVTLGCILQLCSTTGGLGTCRQIHHSLVSSGKGLSLILANSLIHAYGRCASMVDAQIVFDALAQPDVVSWTALIAGYAREGNCHTSLQCYGVMLQAGIEPNTVTFLALLSACNHGGLVARGLEYFESMTRDYRLTPHVEHYATMVDLLGGAGHFSRVKDLMTSLPVQPDMAMLLCLLGACRKHRKVTLGKEVFDSAVRLQPSCTAAYVLMYHIYSDVGLWDHALEIHELRQRAGALKSPGQSWMELHEEVHTFSVGESDHPQCNEVYDLVWKVKVEL